MEDDEEYSYTGYSKATSEAIAEQDVTFKDNEEVYSYTGYADDTAAALDEAENEHARTDSYGDFIIEEFSAESNANRVARITKLPKNAATYCVAAVYLIVGVLCVSITEHITEVLPYIVGGMMVVVGLVNFIVAIVRKEYRHLKTNRTATSLIVVALGVMIIIQKLDPDNDPVMLISIVWGILGLFEGAHAFNHAFKRIANSERCIYYLIKGIIECAVAFMLLYQPDSERAHFLHIMVFGANLIFDAITMIPQVKNFLAMK